MDFFVYATLAVTVFVFGYILFQRIVSSDAFYTWQIFQMQKRREKEKKDELEKYRNTHTPNELLNLVNRMYAGEDVKIKWEAFVGNIGTELLNNLEQNKKTKIDYSAARFLIENLHHFYSMIDRDGKVTLSIDFDPALTFKKMYVVSKDKKIVYTNKIPKREKEIIINSDTALKLIDNQSLIAKLESQEKNENKKDVPKANTYFNVSMNGKNIAVMDYVEDKIFQTIDTGEKVFYKEGKVVKIKNKEEEKKQRQNNNQERESEDSNNNKQNNQEESTKNISTFGTKSEADMQNRSQEETIETEVVELDEDEITETILDGLEELNDSKDKNSEDTIDSMFDGLGLENLDEQNDSKTKDNATTQDIVSSEDRYSHQTQNIFSSIQKRYDFANENAFVSSLNEEMINFYLSSMIEISNAMKNEFKIPCLVKDKKSKDYYVDVALFGYVIAESFIEQEDRDKFIGYFFGGVNTFFVQSAVNELLNTINTVSSKTLKVIESESGKSYHRKIYFENEGRYFQSVSFVINKQRFYQLETNLVNNILTVELLDSVDKKEKIPFVGNEIVKVAN